MRRASPASATATRCLTAARSSSVNGWRTASTSLASSAAVVDTAPSVRPGQAGPGFGFGTAFIGLALLASERLSTAKAITY